MFIGEQAVERHLARALRVHAGRTNLAMFMVGGPAQQDAYAFQLKGLDPSWQAGLYALAEQHKPLLESMNEPIAAGKWVVSNGGMVILLAMHPPAGCPRGKLEVQVRQRSSDDQAIVEFDLDPGAQGTGCYGV